MRNKISVIISIRNRDTQRIENQVQSIRSIGADPSFHIIDYGSHKEYARLYMEMCQKLHLQYTYMYAEGLPWNKCRALNYGARTAQTPFVVTSDADVIYDENIFQWCLENFQDKCFYQVESFWLPKNNNKRKAKSAGHGSPGLCTFLEHSAFEEIAGYDERMVYWGLEDRDFSMRLEKKGYKQIWLPEKFKLYHQWHPVTESNHKRPQTASLNSLKFSWENKIHAALPQDWGRELTLKDRPILSLLTTDMEKNYRIKLEPGALNDWEAADLILNTRRYGFVQVILGPRLKKRPLDFFRNPTKIMLKPFTAFTGNTIISNINSNFDVLYEMLPLLMENGLRDYFIVDDLSHIYLLWT